MEVLFFGSGSDALDPNSHRVRTMLPSNTSFGPCSSSIDIQTFEELPGIAEGHVSRSGSANLEFWDTYKPIHHIGTIPGTSGFSIHKGEFLTNLVHIATMPILELGVILEFIRPILKMRVRQLLRLCRNHGA